MATSATLRQAEASVLDRLDRQLLMNKIHESGPMYRSRPAIPQNAGAGNKSTMVRKDEDFLTKASYSKYGTIQNPGGFDQFKTITGTTYGARKGGGFSSLLKTNVGIFQRNFGAGASGGNKNFACGL